MSGNWIKMGVDLGTHPKVVRIASALKADRLRVVGGLHAVWCLFDAHSADGSLDGYTLDALDDLIGWPGFSAAMVSVGWMSESSQGLDLPRFEEHNGQSAKRRAQETDRKRAARSVPNLSASNADEKRTREEKNREDKKEEIPPASRTPRGVKRCPEDFTPSDDLQAEMHAECPGVDLSAELRKLRDHHFKTARSDWPAVYRNWMREAHARRLSRPSAQSFRERDAEIAAARVHEMTGGLVSAKPIRRDALQEVFDAIPSIQRIG